MTTLVKRWWTFVLSELEWESLVGYRCRYGSMWPRLLRVQAVTLNQIVNLRCRLPSDLDVDNLCLLAHELYHVKQQKEWRWGWPTWLLAYIIMQVGVCLWAWVRLRAATPRMHPWERPAYEFEDRVRRELQR